MRSVGFTCGLHPETLPAEHGNQPGTGDNRVCFQELYRGGGFHLGGNHTAEILLKRDLVGHQSVGMYPQASPELLRLYALPMESNADSYFRQGEGAVGGLWGEHHTAVSLLPTAERAVEDIPGACRPEYSRLYHRLTAQFDCLIHSPSRK